MLHWWPFLAANSYRLSVPIIYVQNSVSFTNSFSRIIFINSLSPTFFYKFNITNSFSRINLRIRKSSKKFVRISHDFVLVRFCEISVMLRTACTVAHLADFICQEAERLKELQSQKLKLLAKSK